MNVNSQCPVCKGRNVKGTTTFTVDIGSGVVIIRNVPATVCDQCGTEWLSDDTVGVLEKIVDKVRDDGTIVDIKDYTKIAS